jgi:hypothetical protein
MKAEKGMWLSYDAIAALFEGRLIISFDKLDGHTVANFTFSTK